MKPLHAAVIGLGFIGPQHMDAIRRTPFADLSVSCDQSADAARGL